MVRSPATRALPSPDSRKTRLPCGARTATSIQGNVYHILLDMMDTDAFMSTVDRLGWQQEFEGFDLFKNNISNYSNTIPRPPAISRARSITAATSMIGHERGMNGDF